MNPHDITHETPPRVVAAPCAGHWRTFDSTRHDLATLAREMCGHCPLLEDCRRQRDEWLAASATNPLTVAGTWAGHTYGGRPTAEPRPKYSRTEAARRAAAAAAKKRREAGPSSHCVNGHRFTEANTYVNPGTGKRQCKTCRAASTRASRERRAELAASRLSPTTGGQR